MKRVEELERESLLAGQAKEALRESEQRYRCLVETMNDGLLVRDENDVIVYVNERLCRMSGYSREEVVGCPLSRFLGDANRDLFEEESAKRRKGASDPYEITWAGKGGQRMVTIMSPRPLFDGQGRYQGSFVVITDITGRKEAEEALRMAWMELEEKVRNRTAELAEANEELAKHRSHLEILVSDRTTELTKTNALLLLETSERKRANEALRKAYQRLEDIIDFLPDATFVIDQKKEVIAWSRAIEQMTGLQKKDIIGKGDYAYAVPFYGEKRPILIDLVMSGECGVEERYDFVERKDNGVFGEVFVPKTYQGKGAYLWGTASPLFDKGGNIIGAIQSIRDITERKRAEEELSKYRDHLEDLVKDRTAELAEANERLTLEVKERRLAKEALKIFAYSVAHDLKSPAIGIYGLAKRLHKEFEDRLDEKGGLYCDQILRVAEHIAALVDMINVYIATKEARLLIEKTNLREILRGLKDEFSSQLSIRQIAWFEPESEVELMADRLSMLRIFRNLIDNALKYGGERLSQIRIEHEDAQDFHIFSVTDNGRGLKGVDSEKLFGLFQRHETSKGIEGAGLGLTIVKEIAAQHGGKVWIQPAAKSGTVFYVSIAKNLRER
jgi:PAS domain S-box-containing protein